MALVSGQISSETWTDWQRIIKVKCKFWHFWRPHFFVIILVWWVFLTIFPSIVQYNVGGGFPLKLNMSSNISIQPPPLPPYLAEQLSLVFVLSLSSPPGTFPRLTRTLPCLPPVWSEKSLLTLRGKNKAWRQGRTFVMISMSCQPFSRRIS